MNEYWRQTISRILEHRPGEDLRIPKWVPSPEESGFEQHFGSLRGQLRDLRLALPSGAGIHLREYNDHYLGHWDQHDPRVNLIGHLLVDCPAETRVAAAAFGGATRGVAGLFFGYLAAELAIALAKPERETLLGLQSGA